MTYARVFKTSMGMSLLTIAPMTLIAMPAQAQSSLTESLSTEAVSVETTNEKTTPLNDIQNLPTVTENTSADSLSPEPIELSQTISRNESGISRNFVGIGGNIGFDDDTSTGDSGFAIISKLAIINRVSLRPAVIFGDNVSFLVPVTYNFVGQTIDTSANNIVPYAGGGVAFSTGDDSEVSGLLSAGVDYPITPQFTANGQLNVSVFNGTGVGILLGVGYNF